MEKEDVERCPPFALSLICCCHGSELSPWSRLWILAQLLAALLEPFSSHLFRGSSTRQHPLSSGLYPRGRVKGPASGLSWRWQYVSFVSSVTCGCFGLLFPFSSLICLTNYYYWINCLCLVIRVISGLLTLPSLPLDEKCDSATVGWRSCWLPQAGAVQEEVTQSCIWPTIIVSHSSITTAFITCLKQVSLCLVSVMITSKSSMLHISDIVRITKTYISQLALFSFLWYLFHDE